MRAEFSKRGHSYPQGVFASNGTKADSNSRRFKIITKGGVKTNQNMLCIASFRRIIHRSKLDNAQGRLWDTRLHIGMIDHVQVPRRSFSSNDENEVLDTDGEWAGCTKRFLKPLRISTRGPGTNDFEKETIEHRYLVYLFVWTASVHVQ